jgi:hypothetical protein
MKIKRRKYARWSNGIGLVLPTIMVYGFGKLLGTKYNNLEYIWWITISVLILIYLCIQFEITND